MKATINAKGTEITVLSKGDENDYISLTDIAKYKNKDDAFIVINNWMRLRGTIEFLGLWEQLSNPDFKPIDFDRFKNEAGSNYFTLSPQKWIKSTNAIGIISKSGRYGGTYAHKDIAFEFASWISAEFKLYIIKDYQRLKIDENSRISLEWNVNRVISKINYKIHTDAIKENLIPKEVSSKQLHLNDKKYPDKLTEDIVIDINGAKNVFLQLERHGTILNPRFVGPKGETPVTEFKNPYLNKVLPVEFSTSLFEMGKEGKFPGFKAHGFDNHTIAIPVPDGSAEFKCRAVIGNSFLEGRVCNLKRYKNDEKRLKKEKASRYNANGLVFAPTSLEDIKNYLLSDKPDLETCSKVLQQFIRDPKTSQKAENLREYLTLQIDKQELRRW